jgi:hypothetical protein
MASSFETTFASQFNAPAAATFAEAVTYNVTGGASKSVSMVVLREMRRQTRAAALYEEYEEMPAHLLASDVTTPKDQFGSNAPDTVTIDGATWYVGEILELNAAGWHRLLLKSRDFR